MKNWLKRIGMCVGGLAVAFALVSTNVLHQDALHRFAVVQKAYALDIIAPTISYYKDLMITSDEPFKLKANASGNSETIENGPEMTKGLIVHGEGMSKNTKDWVYVRYNSQIGWLPLSKTTEVTPLDKQLFAQSDAKITSIPNGGNEVATLAKGDKVVVDADSGDGFYHIYYNSKPGWVAQSVLAESQPVEETVESATVQSAPVVPVAQSEETWFEVLLQNPLVLVVAGLAIIFVIGALAVLAISSRRR